MKKYNYFTQKKEIENEDLRSYHTTAMGLILFLDEKKIFYGKKCLDHTKKISIPFDKIEFFKIKNKVYFDVYTEVPNLLNFKVKIKDKFLFIKEEIYELKKQYE